MQSVKVFLASEKLNLSAPQYWEEMFSANLCDDCHVTEKYAANLAKFMQVEMKRANKDVPTKDIYRKAKLYCNKYSLNNLQRDFAKDQVILCWEHGRYIGMFECYSTDEINSMRKKAEAIKPKQALKLLGNLWEQNVLKTLKSICSTFN